jgi:SH3-like domain-containing protein
LLVWGLTVSAQAQQPDRSTPRQGEVTGNDVYVRSGPSTNHYPTIKLSAGAHVSIVGESGDWYEIVPPEGTFSYISGEYVDTADDKSGVVNGNNVRVRAGSHLPEFSALKYVVQTKLSKGSEVSILGRDADGYLRINPPEGTTTWINRAFVSSLTIRPDRAVTPGGSTDADGKVVDATTPIEKTAAAEPMDSNSIARREPPVFAGAKPSASDMIQPLPDRQDSVLTTLPPSKERDELIEIDKLSRVELGKPIEQRLLKPLIKRYQLIAEQEEDSLARQYASTRIRQLSYMTDLLDSVIKVRSIDSEAELNRRAFLEGRAKIREMLPPIPQGMDVKGELRTSSLYPPGTLPRRYRLVDATGASERTIGYVEIPSDTGIDSASHVGQYVGVRASAKRLQTGGVNPVPIYIAAEIINLQPPDGDSGLERQE